MDMSYVVTLTYVLLLPRSPGLGVSLSVSMSESASVCPIAHRAHLWRSRCTGLPHTSSPLSTFQFLDDVLLRWRRSLSRARYGSYG